MGPMDFLIHGVCRLLGVVALAVPVALELLSVGHLVSTWAACI